MTDAPRSHELLDDWSDVIARELVDQLKLPEAQACVLGMHIAQAIAEDFAGQQIYVPAFYSAKIAEKHQLIYDDYRGKQHAIELCRKHDITERTLYRILARVGAADLASRQESMFEKEPT